MLKLLMEDVDVDVVLLPLLIIVNSHAKKILFCVLNVKCYVLFQFYHVRMIIELFDRIGRINY